MSLRQRKNMHMKHSFRKPCYSYYDFVDNLRLNVHRKLHRLAIDSTSEESQNRKEETETCSTSQYEIKIENITSVDLSKDYALHFRYHKRILSDVVYIEGFWDAICGNEHLFKDKVSFNYWKNNSIF